MPSMEGAETISQAALRDMKTEHLHTKHHSKLMIVSSHV